VESASRNTTSLVELEKKRNEKEEGDERRVAETKETVSRAMLLHLSGFQGTRRGDKITTKRTRHHACINSALAIRYVMTKLENCD
jgi:hypothetical protein